MDNSLLSSNYLGLKSQIQLSQYCKIAHTVIAVPARATPNPSFKRSPNGRPPGPRGAVVYPAPRGPGVLPSVPA